MNKYDEIIKKLKSKGVEFEKGLTEKELSEIQDFYKISFPAELKEFFKKGLPISKGFYNWRNADDKNIDSIKKAIDRPINDLIEELKNGEFWCEEWGEKPADINQAEQIIIKHYKNADKLIPIYSHRYLASTIKFTNMPVLSVMGSDVIYYGENLISYLEIEFGFKNYNDMNYDECAYVNFWSELM